MPLTSRSRFGGRLWAEIALASLVGMAVFALVATLSAGVRTHAPAPLVGFVLIVAVLSVAHYGGVVYAVPVGLASIVAFDWYFLPPIHALSVPDVENAVTLGVFILTAVLVGQVAAGSARRAEAAEEARLVLADEQAALRRVATLVAEQSSPEEIFATVADEISELFGVPLVGLVRYGPDRTATVIGGTSDLTPLLGRSWSIPPNDPSVLASVLTTGRPARLDDYAALPGGPAETARELDVASTVGIPIVVDGVVWGGAMIAVSTGQPPLPPNTVDRLTAFTELVATAISNAAARAEVERLAEEQASLRRVATLVAKGVEPNDVFAAVAEEITNVLDVDTGLVFRFEPDGTATAVARFGAFNDLLPVGTNWALDRDSVTSRVWRTGRTARIDDYRQSSGPIADALPEGSTHMAAGAPIVIDDRLWGLAAAASSQPGGLPADAEERIANFADLIATAIGSAEASAELAASRARVVAAGDDARRRFERDLHDGIQQRLVSLALEVRTAESMASGPADELHGQLARIVDGLGDALDDLREISRGIHPAILSEGGLGPALRALARRSAVPVALDVNVDSRLDERVEAAAYYIASEAVANAVKHAGASVIELRVNRRDDSLTLSIRDDGAGGADPSRGSGLIGLTDRVEALAGTILLVSPVGDGTSLDVTLPL